MSEPPRTEEPPFWPWFLVRLLGVFVAGLALILFFREVLVPLLKGDVERAQKDHHSRP